MVRIHNLSKWERVKKGEDLVIRADGNRRVRLECNAPEKVKAFLVAEDMPPVFLAVWEGMNVLEFTAPEGRKCAVDFVGGDVWVFTAEGDQIAMPRPASPSFVRVANRRARNPELEKMMFMMTMNIERRLAAQKEEYEATLQRLEARRRAEAKAAGADVETGEVVDDGRGPEAANPTGDQGSAGGSPEGGSPAAAKEGEAGKNGKRSKRDVPAGSD